MYAKLFKNNEGFTLVELLVVVAIIVILTSAIVPRLILATTYARYSRTKAEMATFRTIVESYEADQGNSSYPKASNDLQDSTSIASVFAQAGIKWGTVDGIRDPWGHPYLYSAVPHDTSTPNIMYSYAFVSAGPDGKFGNADDVWCTDNQPPLQQNSTGLWFVTGSCPQVFSAP
ncbi:general secretion pathway protein G [Thermoanaerobacter thermohydrosulfuricus]|uniref:General secretion pathway protein G n=1 Tax=Thermoanaerobacter thermohydrosulfuricus TaxID=1516 RepID=A0A1G7IUZ4_THETY|nr:prepilin-type N-terminal cleavage/methylation domain-containing protein [Thermoanaerobacter thermohydrosulfuricus]SDF16487.1 general secretion pathway protein G [Thermoanaerobacter thermohydrosulfuricus]